MGWFCTLLGCLGAVLVCVSCLDASSLYDHVNIGKSLPNEDDVSSEEVQLRVPIIFYGQAYSGIFVNSNGLLSFQTEIPTFFNYEFPLAYPVIAPLYSNIDTSSQGTISFYETDNPEHLQKATNSVRRSFSLSDDFQATNLFVATWSNVGYHKNRVDRLNTFQVAIASDGDDSFVEFLYPENGIQWIQGTGDESGLPDARAQAGFVAADGRYYVLQGSGTDQVRYLEKWTNLNEPGHYIFRIGQVDQDANVDEPDTYNDVLDNTTPRTCEKGITQCHGFAKCVDYNEGFCCVCKNNYYGNGKFCVKNDVPLRANGKIIGNINGENLPNLDLQSYIVMADGRAYTAVSKIPSGIGSDIQSLQILGGVLGWVFAKPIADALNGFQLTGGVFNHTANIKFIPTNQTINIRHKYLGLDVFDQVRLEVEIHGEIPRLPPDTKVTFSEYEEHYTLTNPSTIQSSSSRSFSYINVDAAEVALPFSLDQSFVFDSCKFNRSLEGSTWKLKVGKTFISYEATEQIVRFGLSDKIGPMGDHDPCNEGRSKCGPNSSCVIENDAVRCVCNPGYQYIWKETGEAACEDVNECQIGQHECDYNAQCVNVEGSYSCRCNPGFEGNGRTCENLNSCRQVRCQPNTECVEENGAAICRCLPGFVGNGQICVPVEQPTCLTENNCSPKGFCTRNPQTIQYVCVCLPGYMGDGYNCLRELAPSTTEVYETQPPPSPPIEGPVLAQCDFKQCYCPPGFQLDPETPHCVRQTIPETTTVYSAPPTTQEIHTETLPPPVSCSVSPGICHRDAQCIYDLSLDSYQCACNFGFEGDGFRCQESQVICNHPSVCDPHATCTLNDLTLISTCVCDRGYIGNGRECRQARCVVNEDCPTNEQCLSLASTQDYECVCNEGLMRDSQQLCVKLEGTCSGAVCHEQAECLYDEDYETNYCSCKSEYEGDGIYDCQLKVKGCEELNNCSPYAACLFDQDQGRYQCRCNEGFLGDGYSCNVERTCHTDPRMCHPYALCITTSQRKYICDCQPGYVGNGTHCQEVPKHEGNFLIVNQGKATLRIPFETSSKNSAKLTHIDEFQTAVGLDIDCLLGRVYWSDISGRTIKSSTYNGSNVTDFINTDIGSPEGLSIDWVARNIYWTDSTKDTIEVANLETKLRTTLFNTSLVNPRGIAVHPQRGKIFWTDWDRKHPKIEWANADGTGRQIFLEGPNVQLPNSLVIDFDTERLCYADAGTKKIECLDIDTRYGQTIAENCTYPFGIATTYEHVYWSDWIVKKIERVDKRSMLHLPSLSVPLGGSNKLYGLVAVPDRCLGLTNVCQYFKTQCPADHICLPDGGGSRRCLCGYKIDSPNEKTSCALQ